MLDGLLLAPSRQHFWFLFGLVRKARTLAATIARSEAPNVARC